MKLKRYSSRLVPAVFFSVIIAGPASAESAAEVASRWGLIGRWSLDCSLPPDHERGAVLSYEIAANGRLIHRRDFGDKRDEDEVIGARISDGNLLNLRILFRPLKQAREFGLMMLPDGAMRAIYNRGPDGRYTIRDGRFTANGEPTPPEHKCSQ